MGPGGQDPLITSWAVSWAPLPGWPRIIYEKFPKNTKLQNVQNCERGLPNVEGGYYCDVIKFTILIFVVSTKYYSNYSNSTKYKFKN